MSGAQKTGRWTGMSSPLGLVVLAWAWAQPQPANAKAAKVKVCDQRVALDATHLDKLQILDLPNTPVEDLGPLAGCAALQRLDLSGTKVRDLTPLVGLRTLVYLDLTDTPAARDRGQRRALERALPHLEIVR